MTENKEKGITTDKALIFSAIVLLVYTIVNLVFIWFDKMPDSTLTASIFLAFGVAEGGYCTYIHKMKKKSESEEVSDGDSD